MAVGFSVGIRVGLAVGAPLGLAEGVPDGLAVGAALGLKVGTPLGFATNVGAIVGTPDSSSCRSFLFPWDSAIFKKSSTTVAPSL